MCDNSEEFWRQKIAKEVLETCPDTTEWGEPCPDCSEVSAFIREARS